MVEGIPLPLHSDWLLLPQPGPSGWQSEGVPSGNHCGYTVYKHVIRQGTAAGYLQHWTENSHL